MIFKEHVIDVILSTVLVFTFIGLFFFSYGAHVEEQIVKEQIDYIIEELVKEFKIFAPEYVKQAGQQIKTVKPPELEKADKAAADKNKAIKDNVMKISGYVLIGGLAVAALLMLVFRNSINITNVLIGNIVAFFGVAITYWAFTATIIRPYRPMDPNIMKAHILKIFQGLGGELTPEEQARLLGKHKDTVVGNIETTTGIDLPNELIDKYSSQLGIGVAAPAPSPSS